MRKIGSNGCLGLAADLVRHKVDVIAAAGTLAPLSAKQASSTIPIVMTSAGDPLGSGLLVLQILQEAANQSRGMIGPRVAAKLASTLPTARRSRWPMSPTMTARKAGSPSIIAS